MRNRDSLTPPARALRVIGAGPLPALLGAVVLFSGSGIASAAGGSPRTVPAAGSIEATLPLSPRETPLFAARGDTMFLITFAEQDAKSITVERVDPNGAFRWRRLPFALAYYLMDLSVGPHGLYAGTSVIRRFTNASDELVRIDRETLAIRARASFAARVAAVEAGQRIWASIGDGRVVRLDPMTLRVLAARRLLPAADTTQGQSLSKPAVGLGSLWVIAGDLRGMQLVRMDPATLTVRSRTRLPLRAVLSQVIGDSDHVYLFGTAIASVDARGKLVGGVIAVPHLAAAAIYGDGLVGETAAPPSVELLTARGRVVARTALDDASDELAVGGSDAWLLGGSGMGNGIVHLRLRGHA